MFGLPMTKTEKAVVYACIVAIMVVVAFPLYWLVNTSFKYDVDSSTNPPQFLPKRPTIENYSRVFSSEELIRFVFNSLSVAVLTVMSSMIIGSMAAYAISKTYLSYAIRNFLLIFVLIIRIFPPITTLIPYYLILSQLKLLDTHLALVITYTSYCLPFVIWLMLGFFQDLPGDIEKAAIVDGCSYWQRFSRITFPLTLPGLAVTAIFAFIYAWNEFMFASMLTSRFAKTLPVVIATFISDKYLRWGEMSALGVIMVVPIIVFSSFGQRYLVRGLTFGAVKE